MAVSDKKIASPRRNVKTQVALGTVYDDDGNLKSLYVWTRVVELAVSLSKQIVATVELVIRHSRPWQV